MTRKHRMILNPLSLLVAITLVVACGQTADTSRTFVTDGKIIADTNKPAVVQISAKIDADVSASCSSTWVSHNTIVTAAHCVFDSGKKLTDIQVSRGVGKGAKALKILSHSKYVDADSVPEDNYDVALLIFPDNSSNEFIAVAPAPPSAGDPITIVGFGKYDHSNDNSGGKKRTGNNNVDSIGKTGRIVFSGALRPTSSSDDGTGENSVNSQGDSGGPMFFKDKIIGISSTVNTPADAATVLVGNYENLRHPPIEAWLREMVSTQGAVIRGLAGDDSVPVQPELLKGDILVHIKKDSAAGKIDFELASIASAKKIQYSKYDSVEAMNSDKNLNLSLEVTFIELRGARSIFSGSIGSGTAAVYFKVRALNEAGKTVAERKIKISPL